jgi:vitamin B12 transporter
MRTKISLRTSLAAIFLLFPASALSQNLDETIIVTAARTPIPASDTTASISLLTTRDLDARGAVFIADALRSVPGLAVSRSGPSGALTQIRARGSEANHLLVLIDGVEATNPFTGEADFAHMAFDDLATIEVARGEQSALWGADAIGGVIHLTSAHPEAGRFGRLRLESGSFETHRVSASLASGFEHGFLSVSLAGFESNGIDVSGRDGEVDGYTSRTASFSGLFRAADNLSLDANLRWVGQTSEFDNDINYDGRLDNTDSTRRGGPDPCPHRAEFRSRDGRY